MGSGIDILEVQRVRRIWDRFGKRFLRRILLPEEAKYCLKQSDPVPSIAVRFAAKEAVSKALGTGITRELGWLDIEIKKRKSGQPYVVLHGKGKELLEKQGGEHISISMSHAQTHVASMAILQKA